MSFHCPKKVPDRTKKSIFENPELKFNISTVGVEFNYPEYETVENATGCMLIQDFLCGFRDVIRRLFDE